MRARKQGPDTLHWGQSKHRERLFGDTKWDGKEFHRREWIDYGLCWTNCKGKGVTGTTRDRGKA
jgi:hypothetical protein